MLERGKLSAIPSLLYHTYRLSQGAKFLLVIRNLKTRTRTHTRAQGQAEVNINIIYNIFTEVQGSGEI